MKTIWAHTLVRNEEKWVWFSVMSVIDHVDKLLLWDMESTDNTPNIIKELIKIYPDKILFKKVKKVDPEGFAKVRQQMLDETNSDWFMVVDGDEIWFDDSITEVTNNIRKLGKDYESMVVPLVNLVGDIFHYQESAAGRYTLAGRTGHYALRAINRKIPGLSSNKPHGTWGWTDGEGKMVQDRDRGKMLFLDSPYFHTTHLPRAGTREIDNQVIKRGKKLKFEIGNSFPLDYYYPEVFFKDKPSIVPSPWQKMSDNFYKRALLETPLRKIKRRLFKGKIGY